MKKDYYKNQKRKGVAIANTTIKYLSATIFNSVNETLQDVEKTLNLKGLSEGERIYFEAQKETLLNHLNN